MGRRQAVAAIVLGLAGFVFAARSVEAQKMYKWTDEKGNVHFSNVAPTGEKAEPEPSLQGVEASEPSPPARAEVDTAPPVGTVAQAPTGEPQISDDAFSSKVSATRSRLKRELAQAKEESTEAGEKLAALTKQRDEPTRMGLEILQKAYGPDQHQSTEEADLRKKKEKADARIAEIRKQYADLHDEAVKRLGHEPSYWLPLD